MLLLSKQLFVIKNPLIAKKPLTAKLESNRELKKIKSDNCVSADKCAKTTINASPVLTRSKLFFIIIFNKKPSFFSDRLFNIFM